MSEELVSLVNQAMRNDYNQYPPMPGCRYAKPLRKKLNFYIRQILILIRRSRSHPRHLCHLFFPHAILQRGDEVIVFEPAYDSYIPNVEINGAVAVKINLVFPDYKIDWDAVKKAISPKTKAILVNSPHNPTGSVTSAEDIEQLRSVVKDTNIFIISDEVYEHLISMIFLTSPYCATDLLQRSFVAFPLVKYITVPAGNWVIV
ncbi:MAG: aminotransferase class I/II-fold pyridoxal phosphate-dependent enzyme [Bacteroidota bacterium]